ncbi:hypothetical protein [Spiribacter salilacus]|uniref:hypothetical protein n=1 Tax=Spiribacter salilacus TaxID=2664894 RepID=UPI001C12B3E3|nr:hypothetical protein [Spiribacter salilacus]
MLNEDEELDLCIDYIETIDQNIKLFLEARERKMEFWIERAQDDFPSFWSEIGAEGDLAAAVAEFDNPSNTSEEMGKRRKKEPKRGLRQFAYKTARAVRGIHRR